MLGFLPETGRHEITGREKTEALVLPRRRGSMAVRFYTAIPRHGEMPRGGRPWGIPHGGYPMVDPRWGVPHGVITYGVIPHGKFSRDGSSMRGPLMGVPPWEISHEGAP